MIEQRRSRTQVAPTNVALFVTCVGDLVAPGAPRADVEVLEAMGVRVEVPRAQTCCGQPALTPGTRRRHASWPAGGCGRSRRTTQW